TPAGHAPRFLPQVCALRALPSFPTRRSSDLWAPAPASLATHPAGSTNWMPPPPAHRAAASAALACVLSQSWPAAPQSERRARERSEEHTSELQSREKVVCRVLLEVSYRPWHR